MTEPRRREPRHALTTPEAGLEPLGPADPGEPAAAQAIAPAARATAPAEVAPVGPLLGQPLGDRYHSTRLRQLAHLELDESEAAALWQRVGQHRTELSQHLGRDVGQRVALLDYLVNVRGQLVEPQIIEKADLEAIERHAVKDAATGLYNRHYFESALVREAERCRRYAVQSSLVLLDLDHFKAINDQYGHRIGDEVLQVVGDLLLRHVRAADVACRYGGDEFALLLPDTSCPEAHGVAERICADIRQTFWKRPVGGQFLGLTASGGVATLASDGWSAERLFGASDRALYSAKAAGGNRVVATHSRL